MVRLSGSGYLLEVEARLLLGLGELIAHLVLLEPRLVRRLLAQVVPLELV